MKLVKIDLQLKLDRSEIYRLHIIRFRNGKKKGSSGFWRLASADHQNPDQDQPRTQQL